jgi:regulator of sigma E protease
MNFLIFVIVLSILVLVHEWGHFIAAKSLGVKVQKFSMGFGPKLFSRVYKGTEFMVCAIPLGGFVKMAGDERSECQGNRDEFYSHPVGHRAIIVLMGPFVNVVFAVFCFFVTFMIGYPNVAAKVGAVMENSPSYRAGLQVGDKIVQIDSKKIENWEDLQQYVSTSKGQSLHFVIKQGEKELTKDIVPEERTVTNVFHKEVTIRIIGIQPYEEFIFVKYPPLQALQKAFHQVGSVTILTFKALYYVITGAMPAKEAFGGPIKIFDVVKDAASVGISYLIYIMAIISTNLAIFNLFPIPVLDGGHLFLQAMEKLRGRPLPLRIEEGLTKTGLALLLTLMVFVFYNDMDQAGWFQHIRVLLHK